MNDLSEAPVVARLSAEQRSELLRKCHNRLNWSDSGNWIGSGPIPNCFQKERISNHLTHTLHFPTDDSAMKWNAEYEKAIRYTGHLATAGLTVAATLATGGVLTSIVVGIAAAVLKDEMQASVSYPRVARGWHYELTYQNEFLWSPHPWGRRCFTQGVIAIARDWEGAEKYRAVSKTTYNTDELPDGLARTIASARSRASESNYV